MKDLRLELRFKNAVLLNNIQRVFLPPKGAGKRYSGMQDAATAIGVRYESLLDLLRLAKSPYSQHHNIGEPNQSALKIAQYFGLEVWELFPMHLYSGRFPKLALAEIDALQFLTFGAAQAQHLLPAIGSPEDEAIKAEITEALQQVLGTLTPQEQDIVNMRFGLNGESPHTLAEVGAKRKLSGERIRQIESKAFRKLRHHSRSDVLRRAQFGDEGTTP